MQVPTLFSHVSDNEFSYDYRSVKVFQMSTPCMMFVICIMVYHIEFFSYRGKDSQGEEVIKPYTPTTLDSDIGYFDLVIKV